jgi:hypothetical protein
MTAGTQLPLAKGGPYWPLSYALAPGRSLLSLLTMLLVETDWK